MRPRPVGSITRGTTNPNRLRRVDNWIAATCGSLLREADDPLVVDLGYGQTPITTVELRARLATAVRPDVRVVGLEIDPERVAAAAPYADPPGLTFARGGFELAGLRPVVVRAFNVLRQYDESAVPAAWRTILDALAPGPAASDRRSAATRTDVAGRRGRSERSEPVSSAPGPAASDRRSAATRTDVAGRRGRSERSEPDGSAGGGVLVEGTCDELGRLASWLLLDATGPRSLTLAAKLSTLDSPMTLAERLPKALIHRNVPGEPIHAFLEALDGAWRAAAPYAVFGPRQRWLRAVAAVRDAGWPVLDRPARWRRGEVTVAWSTVTPSYLKSG